MLILITKDGATRIAKEVRDLAEAKTFADMGFMVHAVEDGVETPLADLLAAADGQIQPAPAAVARKKKK
jgi:hypothetical protein